MHTDDRPLSWLVARSKLNTLFLGLALCSLWSLTHTYLGVSLDGELYAMQALSRIHTNLQTDLYLRYTNQDHFTLFSPLYASVIRTVGLINAATLLFVVCTTCMLAATYCLATVLCGRESAWLSAAGLVVLGGVYGSFAIFSSTENYMTARLPAEALSITACTCYLRGWRIGAFILIFAAFAIHPIMALPGLLLVISLGIGWRRSVLAASAGVVVLLAVALVTRIAPHSLPIQLIQDQWLEVVRERSQFLFIQYWNWGGYEQTLRPLLCLVLTTLVVDDPQIRKVSIAAILVGVTGLAVNAVASLVSPMALVLQGQSWRWMWLTALCSVVLLPYTLISMLRDARCGRFCAMAMLLAWAFPGLDSVLACVAGGLVWVIRGHLTPNASRMLAWGTAIGILMVVLWVIANCIGLFQLTNEETGRGALWETRVRDVLGLEIPAVLLTWLMWRLPGLLPSTATRVAASAFMICVLALFLPGSLRTISRSGSNSEVMEFADWRDRIPPSSTVLELPVTSAAGFIWFTLRRPSFLTTNQEAGVIFSPATASEVARRSQTLLPVKPQEDWRIYSAIERRRRFGPDPHTNEAPLTAETLRQICADASLGFVISKDSVGYRAIQHDSAGKHEKRNLYDCSYVRSAGDAG